MEINEEYLEHHGILGMKWGVRRYQNKDGTLTAAGKKRAAKLESEYNKLMGEKKTSSDRSSSNKKMVKELTNEELQERINRLNLEQRYSELMSKQNPKKESRAKKFVIEVLEDSGKNIAKQSVTFLMGKGVNKLFEKAGLGPDVINPKKGQKDK